ncbi:MAG: undecaprenyl-phosphate galactose phosphotransferase WbaP, partial [Selenomonas sp.]|nr:undecaprenyl-phosphate galactose phosphotransferase WbaP [Selenomonas sp.]
MAFDYLAILFAEEMALELHEIYGMIVGRTFYVPFSYLLFWIPLVFIAFLWGMQTYTKMQPVLETVRKIFYAVLYSMIACILALYFMQAGLLASRLYVVLFGCLALLSIYAVRYILLKLLKATHTLTKPVILIGAGKTAEQVLHFFDGDLGYRYEVIGILDDHPISKTLPQQFQLMGTLADAKTIIRSSGVDTVIITAPGLQSERLGQLIS